MNYKVELYNTSGNLVSGLGDLYLAKAGNTTGSDILAGAMQLLFDNGYHQAVKFFLQKRCSVRKSFDVDIPWVLRSSSVSANPVVC